MLLKVGELAARTGLTVRTLHHYDTIGLLKPSARTDAGYRLYSRSDVARLHGIQALQQFGLPLSDIGSMLDGDGAALPHIIARQIQVLDQEVAKAAELRASLELLQERLAKGDQPEISDWLGTLALMTTYSKYFSPAEQKTIFDNWKHIADKWPPLIAEIRSAMDRGVPADSLELQPLAYRWMNLMLHWMDGDFDLLERWGHMYNQEPVAQQKEGPSQDMVEYISKPIKQRLAVLGKYLEEDELKRLGKVSEDEWKHISESARSLIQQGTSAHSPEAQKLARQWNALMDRLTDHDNTLRAKLMAAHAAEPLLRAAAVLDTETRDFLRKALTLT
ncbi:MerR family transcriptional regulator [Polaromonas sp. A23]|uniref:MerR family transcriptional regulator n=1 Tax=Polaromonas sp. A23 TaxID=1944133 RepID=UPI0009856A4C|nr:MerR family transcriptional regulator [Polaromonas sp. A23]OOG42936.1 MerR family transcriptional regulator [Polaromonas sp. A23]